MPKIAKLNPERYILVTSVELSRQNKQKLQTALSPYIKAESDIWGREDLEDFSGRHPNLERHHYKLWLSSASVLEHVFNNAVVGRSSSVLEEIREKVSLFVQTSDYKRGMSNGVYPIRPM